jgi:hypothetical protein
MFRFISHLFKLHYEPCKGCEVLKNQLDIANDQNNELRRTLLDLIKPKVFEAPAVPINPVRPRVVNWEQKKRELEEQDRAEAKIREEHIKQLEVEMEIGKETKEG